MSKTYERMAELLYEKVSSTHATRREARLKELEAAAENVPGKNPAKIARGQKARRSDAAARLARRGFSKAGKTPMRGTTSQGTSVERSIDTSKKS